MKRGLRFSEDDTFITNEFLADMDPQIPMLIDRTPAGQSSQSPPKHSRSRPRRSDSNVEVPGRIPQFTIGTFHGRPIQISALPDDLLGLIIDYLPSRWCCRRVNFRWYRMVTRQIFLDPRGGTVHAPLCSLIPATDRMTRCWQSLLLVADIHTDIILRKHCHRILAPKSARIISGLPSIFDSSINPRGLDHLDRSRLHTLELEIVTPNEIVPIIQECPLLKNLSIRLMNLSSLSSQLIQSNASGILGQFVEPLQLDLLTKLRLESLEIPTEVLSAFDTFLRSQTSLRNLVLLSSGTYIDMTSIRRSLQYLKKSLVSLEIRIPQRYLAIQWHQYVENLIDLEQFQELKVVKGFHDPLITAGIDPRDYNKFLILEGRRIPIDNPLPNHLPRWLELQCYPPLPVSARFQYCDHWILITYCRSFDRDYGSLRIHGGGNNFEVIDPIKYLRTLLASCRSVGQINVQDAQGYTPLHHLILRWRWESVKLVLSYGANPNIKNHQDVTPLTLLLRELMKMPFPDDEAINPFLEMVGMMINHPSECPYTPAECPRLHYVDDDGPLIELTQLAAVSKKLFRGILSLLRDSGYIKGFMEGWNPNNISQLLTLAQPTPLISDQMGNQQLSLLTEERYAEYQNNHLMLANRRSWNRAKYGCASVNNWHYFINNIILSNGIDLLWETTYMAQIRSVVISRILLASTTDFRDAYYHIDHPGEGQFYNYLNGILSLSPKMEFPDPQTVVYPIWMVRMDKGILAWNVKQLVEYHWKQQHYKIIEVLLGMFRGNQQLLHLFSGLDYTHINVQMIRSLIRKDYWLTSEYLILLVPHLPDSHHRYLPIIASEGSVSLFYHYLLARPQEIIGLEDGKNCFTRAIIFNNFPIIRLILCLLRRMYQLPDPDCDPLQPRLSPNPVDSVPIMAPILARIADNLVLLDGFYDYLKQLDVSQSISCTLDSTIRQEILKLPHTIVFDTPML